MVDILKFTDIIPIFDNTFWTNLHFQKSNEYDKTATYERITGNFNATEHVTKLDFSFSSFNKLDNTPMSRVMKGELSVLRTKEELDNFVYSQSYLLMKDIWDSIQSGSIFDTHDLLNQFTLSIYIDGYKFYYWIAFPVFKMPYEIPVKRRYLLNQLITTHSELDLIYTQINGHWQNDPNVDCFTLNNLIVQPLTTEEMASLQYCSNPKIIYNDKGCDSDYPGWALRNLLFAIAYHIEKNIHLTIICYREDHENSIMSSPVFDIILKPSSYEGIEFKNNIPEYFRGLVYNKSNETGKIIPFMRDMNKIMGKTTSSTSIVSTNSRIIGTELKNFDMEIITKTKCLIIGTGTLCCNAIRNMISWGITNITVVGDETVSRIDIIKQNIYLLDDLGKNKAKAIEKNLKKLYGKINITGIDIRIPEPDDREENMDVLQNTLEQIDQLFRDNHVILLLTETIESKWLPTVLATAYNMPCFTALTGFEKFLVMRHGRSLKDECQMACCFCNDPDDIEDKSRTSRPGVETIASSWLVELLVSFLASCKNKTDSLTKLVKLPQNIYGDVSVMDTTHNKSPASPNCIACSPEIMKHFKSNSIKFIKAVLMNKNYLSGIVGVNAQPTNSVIFDESLINIELDNLYSEVEKQKLLPIISGIIVDDLMDVDLAKEIFDSLSKIEQQRLKNLHDFCGYESASD